MSYVNLTATEKTARMNVVLAAIGNGATIGIYDGTHPTGPLQPVTGTLLATLTCATPFGTVAAGGVLTMGTVTAGTAVATSTATWARIYNSAGVGALDMDVSLAGGTGSMQLNDTAIVSGNTVAITAGTITET